MEKCLEELFWLIRTSRSYKTVGIFVNEVNRCDAGIGASLANKEGQL